MAEEGITVFQYHYELMSLPKHKFGFILTTRKVFKHSKTHSYD